MTLIIEGFCNLFQRAQRLFVLGDDLRGLRQEEPLPRRLRRARSQRRRQRQGFQKVTVIVHCALILAANSYFRLCD